MWNLKNPNRQNANPTRRDCPEPRLRAGGKSPLVWQRERKGIGLPWRALQPRDQVKSLELPGSRTRPWKWEHLSTPDPMQSQAWDSQGERPGTQGPGVGRLWVPAPALPCPQPSPLWPRRLAVSGAGAPGVICAPGRAGPFPPRAAAPPYRTPCWRGLTEPTSPGTRDSQWIVPLVALLPWGSFPKLSLLHLGLPS